MRIKKVDDKPMVIHTKAKAKIHAHEPKGAKIKGSNIYTVEKMCIRDRRETMPSLQISCYGLPITTIFPVLATSL